MKNILLLFMVFICSCSNYKGDKDGLNYDKITIEFKGYSEAYNTKEKIVFQVSDSKNIQKLNELKNLSERKWFANVKGTDYVIRLIFTDTKTGKKLLVRILKSIDSTPSIEYGPGTIFEGTFKNAKLVNFVLKIINLEEIKS